MGGREEGREEDGREGRELGKKRRRKGGAILMIN